MRLPQVIGPWRLTKRLGHGAFGAVYLAEVEGDAGFRSQVAVKLLDASAIEANPTIGQSLVDEARLLSRLRHPGIVRVLDLQRISHEFLGETYAMAMEYTPGITLSALLESLGLEAAGLSMPAIISLCAEIAGALDYAHTHVGQDGHPSLIVHRDLKPANLIVTPEGHVKVLDFGIAFAAERGVDATREGMTKGTLPYMSPEQVHGMPVDGRSDLYALGTILFEMLVGEPFVGFYPFGQSDLARMVKRVAELHFSDRQDLLGDTLRRHPHFLDEEPAVAIEAMLEKLLARNPEERFSSSAEMRQALEGLYSYWRPESGRRELREHMDAWYAAYPVSETPGTQPSQSAKKKEDPAESLALLVPEQSSGTQPEPEGTHRLRDSERFRRGALGMILLGLLLFFVAPSRDDERSEPGQAPEAESEGSASVLPKFRISDVQVTGNRQSTEARTTVSFLDSVGDVVLASVLSGFKSNDGMALRHAPEGGLEFALVATRAHQSSPGVAVLWDLRGEEPTEVWRLDDFFEETPELDIGVHWATSYGFGAVDFLPSGSAGVPQALVIAHDRNFAPTWLLRLDSSGQVMGRRYHPGHLDRLFPLDRDNVVVSGVSNRLCPGGSVPCVQEEVVWTVPAPSFGERTEFLPGCGGSPTPLGSRGYSWPKDRFRISSVVANANHSGGFELVLVRRARGTKKECAARLAFNRAGEFESQFSECGFEAPLYTVGPDAGEICAKWAQRSAEGN